jgi:1-acyl-sn-glycerol-3-phosphate acyltransferase
MDLVIRFGEPIDASRYRDRGSDRLVLRQITDELMFSIRELSGQQYVDTYATKQHETLPTAPAVIGPRPDGAERGVASDDTAEPAVPEASDEPDAPRSSQAVLGARPLVDLIEL